MQTDFRKQCPDCPDGVSDFMCCDGTKIGINLASSSIEPIEQRGVGATIPTQQRRHDRTFVTHPTPSERNIVCELVKAYCKLGKSEMNIREKVLIAQIQGNVQLFVDQVSNVFPGESLPAFTEMLSHSDFLLRFKYTELFQVLVSAAGVDDLIPDKYFEHSKAFVETTPISNDMLESYLKACEFFFPELGEVVSRSALVSGGQPSDHTVSLIRYYRTLDSQCSKFPT